MGDHVGEVLHARLARIARRDDHVDDVVDEVVQVEAAVDQRHHDELARAAGIAVLEQLV